MIYFISFSWGQWAAVASLFQRPWQGLAGCKARFLPFVSGLLFVGFGDWLRVRRLTKAAGMQQLTNIY
jgi:hypothetical protein